MKQNSIKKMFTKLVDLIGCIYKNNSHAWVSACIVFIVGVLGNVGYAILIMLLLSIVDFIFGIVASVKHGKGIESSKLRDTPIKIFVYVTIVLVMFGLDCILEYLLNIQSKYISLLCCAALSGVEAWSIIGNLAISFENVRAIPIIQRLLASEINKKTGVSQEELDKAIKEETK